MGAVSDEFLAERAHPGGHDELPTELQMLAAEINCGDYEARLVATTGSRPHLRVRNRHAGVLRENIYAGDGWFWFGWAERVAPVTDVTGAARKITQVLRAVDVRQ